MISTYKEYELALQVLDKQVDELRTLLKEARRLKGEEADWIRIRSKMCIGIINGADEIKQQLKIIDERQVKKQTCSTSKPTESELNNGC